MILRVGHAPTETRGSRSGLWTNDRLWRGPGRREEPRALFGNSHQHEFESERERGLEVRALEVRRGLREMRTFAGEVVVGHRRRSGGSFGVSGGLVQPGAENVVTEDAEGLRGEPVVRNGDVKMAGDGPGERDP